MLISNPWATRCPPEHAVAQAEAQPLSAAGRTTEATQATNASGIQLSQYPAIGLTITIRN